MTNHAAPGQPDRSTIRKWIGRSLKSGFSQTVRWTLSPSVQGGVKKEDRFAQKIW